LPAQVAAAAAVPSRHGAVSHLSPRTAGIRVCSVADFQQLLECPWLFWDQAKGAPATYHWKRHATGGRGLTYGCNQLHVAHNREASG
jgi:hypothetical protein